MNRLRFTILISIILFYCTMYGLYRYLKDEEENLCKMTYMFEYPEYIKIPLSEKTQLQFPKYGLYVYGEGIYAKELRKKNFSGIPMLFIYGNAGSFRQGRSISSVLYRIGLSRRSSYFFNVYFADFREEYSGLYGGVLEDQTAFVIECIRTIRSLYPLEKRVILVGHSMGGVIARAVFSHTKFISGSVSLIYTLATPHKEPVIPFDSNFVTFYNKIFDVWKNIKKMDLADIPLISIGGGVNDIIVRSPLTSFGFEIQNGYHVLTPGMPGVWLSVDHLAIVWCKQLIITISRSIYDLIDVSNNEVTTNMTQVREVLFHHFIERSQDGHFLKTPFMPYLPFSSSGQWIEQTVSPWRFSRSKVFSTVFVLLPLMKNEDILIIASGLVKQDWVFACSSITEVENKTCSEGQNLSHLGKTIPPKTTSERKMIVLKCSELIDKGFTHIVVYISASNSRVDILGEHYRSSLRDQKIVLPSYFERASSFSPIRIKTFPLSENRVFHKLVFSGLSDLTESSNFFLERRVCKTGNVIGQGLVKVTYLWSKDYHSHNQHLHSSYYHIRTTLGGVTTIPIKPETLTNETNAANVIMELLLDPECGYELSLSLSFNNILSQFIKFYGLYIPGYAVAIYLNILGYFLKASAKGSCPSLCNASKFSSFISLVLVPTVVYYGIWFCNITPNILPEPDNIFINYTFSSMLLHRSILYIIAFAAVVVVSFIFENFILGLSMIWIFIKKRTVFEVTEKSMDTTNACFELSNCKIAFGAFLMFVSLFIAGSVALMIGFLFLLGKLLIICIKSKAEEQRRGPSGITAKWHFIALLSLLWMLAASLTIPAFLTWLYEITFSVWLVSDPHAFSSAVMLLSATMMWQLQIPVTSQSYYVYSSHIMQLVSILSALYGVKSVYRQVYFISYSFCVLGIQQFLSSKLENRAWKTD